MLLSPKTKKQKHKNKNKTEQTIFAQNKDKLQSCGQKMVVHHLFI
jgi:hypothetical protein